MIFSLVNELTSPEPILYEKKLHIDTWYKSSRFLRNSEASASEFLKSLEEMFPRY